MLLNPYKIFLKGCYKSKFDTFIYPAWCAVGSPFFPLLWNHYYTRRFPRPPYKVRLPKSTFLRISLPMLHTFRCSYVAMTKTYKSNSNYCCLMACTRRSDLAPGLAALPGPGHAAPPVLAALPHRPLLPGHHQGQHAPPGQAASHACVLIYHFQTRKLFIFYFILSDQGKTLCYGDGNVCCLL